MPITRDRVFDGINDHSQRNSLQGSLNVIVFGDTEGRIDFFTNPLNDLQAQGNATLRYNVADERLELDANTIHVNLGDLFDHGSSGRLISRIYANTFATADNQSNLFITAGNREGTKMRLLTELNNTNIKARILHNDTPNWVPSVSTFAEHLVEALYFEMAEGRKLVFSEAAKVQAIKVLLQDLQTVVSTDAVFAFEQVATQIKQLRLKSNKDSNEHNELANLSAQFSKEIKRTVRSNSAMHLKLRTWIWHLFSKHMLVANSGCEYCLEDAAGNYNNIKLLYLFWALRNTMGCGSDYLFNSTFEYQREELSAEVKERKFSDLDVMQSFIDDITLKNGAYRQIIEKAITALRIDDTLFVHGGLIAESLIVNGQDYTNQGLDDWIKAINLDYRKNNQKIFDGDFDCELPPVCIGNYPGAMGGMTFHPSQILNVDVNEADGIQILRAALNEQQWTDQQRAEISAALDRNAQQSTIQTFTKRDAKTNLFVPSVEPKITSFLKSNGIHRVVVGHHPYGDSALGFQFQQDGIDFISLDITRMKDQRNAMCYARINSETKSTHELRVYLPTPKLALTPIAFEEPLAIAANNVGIDPGVYIRSFTKENAVLFTTRPQPHGFAAITFAMSADAYAEIKEDLERNSIRYR